MRLVDPPPLFSHIAQACASSVVVVVESGREREREGDEEGGGEEEEEKSHAGHAKEDRWRRLKLLS